MRLAAIGIMMTPLETKRKTTPTILVEERKLSKRPLLKACDILGAILEIFVMSVALSKNFKLPTTLKPYDGIGDPRVHMIIFKSMMLVNEANDPFLCQTFPIVLEKAGLCGSRHYPQGRSMALSSFHKHS